MNGRNLAATAVLVLAVAAPQSGAEDAKQRGGGGSSSGSSHSSHSSGGSSSRGSSSGSSGSGYRSSGQSSSGGSVAMTDAQRRHPRAGTGTGYRGYYNRGGYRGGYYGGGYYGGYYRPYYSRPYYWGYGSYPWGGLYFDSYWYGGGPTYYGGTYVQPYGDTGAVRIMVDKEKAKVYVDGYYAGVVDDFDGLFQRLYVSPGRHDITLKLDGYQSERFDVYVQEGGTVKIKHDMVRGSGEQLNSEYARLEGHAGPDADYYAPPRQDDRYAARPDDRDARAAERRDGQGTLRLDVRPDDASVYVDGTFSGSARDLSRLDLPAGGHRVEIVRPGYRTYDRDVDVPSGDAVDLSVELEK